MIIQHKDLRQTTEYSGFMKNTGWEVVKLKNSIFAYAKNIPIIGKVLKIQRYYGNLDNPPSASIIYAEPLSNIPTGFEPAKTCFVPSKTILINLTKSKKTLLANLKQKTRYNIKISMKKGIFVKNSLNIELFINLWHENAKLRGNWLSQRNEILQLWKSFRPNAKLYFAHFSHISIYAKKPVAGLLVIYTKDTAYYMYATSGKIGKEFFAPTALTWHAILDAKKKKKKYFDFEGIYDIRYENTYKWQGFTKFKEGFGGDIVTYPGTFVKHKHTFLKIFNF